MSQFPLIIPDVSSRKPITFTGRKQYVSTAIQTQSKAPKKHNFTYKYSNLFSRQYRIIDNFFGSMLGGATHFDLVHWGDIKQIKSINTVYVVLDDASGLTTLAGRAGNKVLIWNGLDGDYGEGVGGTNLWTDARKSWRTNQWANYILVDLLGTEFTIASNTATTLTVTGYPVSGAYEIYRYETRTITVIGSTTLTLNSAPTIPFRNSLLLFIVYDVFFTTDELTLEPSDKFCPAWGPDYGPYYQGDIQFMQNTP